MSKSKGPPRVPRKKYRFQREEFVFFFQRAGGARRGYNLGRPDVDGERLAVYGISAGGCFAPRAASILGSSQDERIRVGALA